MNNVLFFHGGPGMNGNPERVLLTDRYRQAGLNLHCWDEPSAQRPQGFLFTEAEAYASYQQSAGQFLAAHYHGQPLVLIVYCFATHLLDYLLAHHADKIGLVVLIAPDFCLAQSDGNIFAFVEDDFRRHHDYERAAQMRAIRERYAAPSDENTMQGWLTAVQNPRLFTYYWQTPEEMQAYTQHYAGPYQLDPPSFLSVRRTLREVRVRPSAVPLLVLYGRHDRIISIGEERAFIARHFSNYRVVELAQSSHYPHIEEADKVIGLLKAALAALPTPVAAGQAALSAA